MQRPSYLLFFTSVNWFVNTLYIQNDCTNILYSIYCEIYFVNTNSKLNKVLLYIYIS